MTMELHNLRLPLPAFTLEITAQLGPGITGLSGPSGSGKTTLLEIMAGLRPQATGRLTFQDRVLQDPETGTFVPPWDRQIGYVPQDQALFPHWTVEQNFYCGSQWSRARRGDRGSSSQPLQQYARAAGTAAVLAPQPNSYDASAIIDLLELRPLLPRRTDHLSGGEKARVALGRALMSRPVFLLLDEPMAHLDDRLRGRAEDYLRAVSVEFQLPMLLVSHSAQEMEALCSHVLYLESGRLLHDHPTNGGSPPT